MAYDDELAARIRDVVAEHADSREIRMFGGVCWTVAGHMAVGVVDDDLMVHVGTDGVGSALDRGARRATMGERTMGGVVLVGSSELPDRASLDSWIGPAVERARAKPPKPPKPPRAAR
ncbi:TfoX/Sxy family protein [Myceligenerans indicum]|uniref:TfoX/Sxy family protein n=1 Tax=Myceligenerans indicum TaxID=2593663 RepID=A0ABS1LJ54_9MICO|nr:TfoX/Sxy family protein [Myceligenerans indicum]MBL0886237.1 TfoX/Sxy family protein [Myceligenerans indicum]